MAEQLFTLTSTAAGMAKATSATRMTTGTSEETFIVRAWISNWIQCVCEVEEDRWSLLHGCVLGIVVR
jgi:hypothetical protein